MPNNSWQFGGFKTIKISIASLLFFCHSSCLSVDGGYLSRVLSYHLLSLSQLIYLKLQLFICNCCLSEVCWLLLINNLLVLLVKNDGSTTIVIFIRSLLWRNFDLNWYYSNKMRVAWGGVLDYCGSSQLGTISTCLYWLAILCIGWQSYILTI